MARRGDGCRASGAGKVALSVGLLILSPRVYAASGSDPAAGTPDLTFGPEGHVTTKIEAAVAVTTGVVVQEDGKIIVAGYSEDASTSQSFMLVRYGVDGALDATFGDAGEVLTSFEGRASAAAVVLQRDGKIMVAGSLIESDGKAVIALARYHRDGRLDQGFGTNGTVVSDLHTGGDVANAVAIQPDGRIVIAGEAGMSDGGHPACALVRYDRDGSLDRSFGKRGRVLTTFSGAVDQAFEAVAIQSDGKIVAAGFTQLVSLRFVGALARYHSDGRLDKTFGVGGGVIVDLASSISLNGVVVQDDGKIVVAGQTPELGAPQGEAVVARFERDGALDGGFGASGKIITELNGFGVMAKGLAVDGCGRITTAGAFFLGNKAGNGITVFRYDRAGVPDPDFGTGGRAYIVGGPFAITTAMTIASGGDIVVAGYYASYTNPSYLLVARFHGAEPPSEDGGCECHDRRRDGGWRGAAE